MQAQMLDLPGSRNKPDGAKTLISLSDVHISLGRRPILTGINLEIAKGEFLCIVGGSGCGKTTLLRAVAGLIQPTSGSVKIDGKAVLEPRQDVAVVFQDYGKALLPWRTAYGNVELALEANGTPRERRKTIIEDLLAKVGLGEQGAKYPSELSGGMQQRLQIARCLAQSPAVMLMDEPFGALDAMTRQALQDEILELVASTGTTVFFVTHDLEEAVYLGDRVIGLRPNPGRVGIETGVSLARPRNQLTSREDAEFLRLRRKLFDFIQEAEA
ncbi:ABC transporter ATP-binding protein [Rhizobium sullae]|uniref:ABC transporter ATP-binding protein n=1 Tax=Rhizobium sullae TaxID=50338 RepID=A0ABY5XYN7_RHISU|nr:ABC transporter ATP-binding protein [Rhizobium sullae]UWU19176.1 ABC transporter ATP-binding protein [Rhizobium sullae]